MGSFLLKKAGKLLIIFGGIAYFLIWVVILYTMPDGYGKYLDLKDKKKALLIEKEYQISKMERIQKESGMLKTASPFFIEMIARERLKMAKKGETIIKIVENEKR